MTESDRKNILASHRPERPFPGEPQLGGWYTEEEVEATVEAIRNSMDYRTGFGFIVEEITKPASRRRSTRSGCPPSSSPPRLARCQRR